MDIQDLHLFVEAVRRGSFAAVARDRDRDPSSISRAIAGLEAELGVRLFQRTTRRLALTEAGAQYLARIEPILDGLAEARDQTLAINAAPAGTLRLTASNAFGQKCLTPLLPAFRTAFPDLELELLLTDANLDLVSERIDLAIRLGPRITGDLTARRLFRTRYRVCASPDYLACAPPLARPGDLAGHSCLLFTLPFFRSRWLFRDRSGAIEEVPVRGALRISNALALRDCALKGMGPALLADWLIGDDLAAGRLTEVFPDHEAAATEFETAAWLVFPSRTFLPRKTRATMDFLTARLGKPSTG